MTGDITMTLLKNYFQKPFLFKKKYNSSAIKKAN